MTKYCLECASVFISSTLDKTCPQCESTNTAPTWESESND